MKQLLFIIHISFVSFPSALSHFPIILFPLPRSNETILKVTQKKSFCFLCEFRIYVFFFFISIFFIIFCFLYFFLILISWKVKEISYHCAWIHCISILFSFFFLVAKYSHVITPLRKTSEHFHFFCFVLQKNKKNSKN